MNIRTYEIIAKYIGKQNKTTIKFEPGLDTPCADVENNILRFPDTIKDDGIFAGLATLMHEAAHLRYTKVIPHKELATCPAEFNILNVIEDVRIDHKNFNMLPNVKDFYEDMVKKVKERHTQIDPTQIPLATKVLTNAILKAEQFDKYRFKDKEAEEFEKKHNITQEILQAGYAIDRMNYKEAKRTIDKLVKLFGWDKNPPPQMVGFITGKGKTGMGEGQKGQEQGQGQAKGIGISLTDTANDGTFGSKGQGEGTTRVNPTLLGSVGLEEQTKQKFKELLNLKERRTIEDGDKVDTDNLTSFYTGDLEELFYEDKIIHNKKSKIMLLMDASGSMNSGLLCGKSRKSAVMGCVKDITKVLDEVIQTEGLSVDYDIACFTSEYFPLHKESWEKEYATHSGGTNAVSAFTKAQDVLLKAGELDGHRLIVMFTDGDVSSDEIDEIKRRILQHNADVRCMIIGVGANLNGDFVKNVVGDINIISTEIANEILIEVISTMIGG